jgi:TP901 family phage tail tape measure protein
MALSSNEIRVKVQLDAVADGSGFRAFDDDLQHVGHSSDGAAHSFDVAAGSLEKFAAGAAAIGAVVYALNDMAQSAMKVDKGIREIGTLMDNVTEGSLKSMRSELGAMSVEFGQSMDTLTKARYDIVSSGFTSAADSALLLKESSKLAVGGVTEVSTAADVLTTVISAYQLKASDAGTVSDDLFTIVKLGKTTMSELGTQFGVVAAVAAPMGVSVDEVGAALAALTVQGQSTSVATTSISASIMELSKPSKEMVAALKSIGIESDNLIKTGGGLTGALDLVKRVQDETGISANKLFQREEALRAIMPLVGTASKTYADDLKEMGDNAGATDAAFNQMAKSSAFLQEQAKAAFVEVKNDIGDAMINSDLLKGSLVGVKDVLVGFDEGFSGKSTRFVSDMSDMEKAARSFGISIKTAGEWLGGIGTKIDAFEAGLPKWIEKLDAKLGIVNGYQSLIAKIAQGQTPAISGGTMQSMSNDAENTYGMSLMAMTSSTKEATAATTGHTAANKAHTASANAAARVQESWKLAVEKAHAALNKMGQTSLPSVAEATDAVAAAAVEVNRQDAAGKRNGIGTRELTAATERLTAAQSVLQRVTSERQRLEERVASALAKADESTLTYALAKEVEAWAVQNLTELQINKSASDEELRVALIREDEAHKLVARSARAAAQETERLNDAFKGIGQIADLFGLNSAGVSALLSGVNGLSDKNLEKSAADKYNGDVDAARNAQYASLAQSVGQVIGGRTGATVSNAATGASAGMSIGSVIPVVGTLVGGLVGGAAGLIGSLFGGSKGPNQAQQTAQQSAASNANSVAQLAAAGSDVARAIMARAGYSASTLAGDVYGHTVAAQQSFSGLGIDKYLTGAADRGLFYTKENDYNQALVDFLTATHEVEAAIAAVADPAIVGELDQIAYKYDEIASKIGDSADLQRAKLDEQIVALTGLSVDAVTGMVDSAMTSSITGEAGKAIAQSLDDTIAASLRKMAEAQVVQGQLMPLLQPMLDELVTGMVSGSMSSEQIAAGYARVQATTQTFVPILDALEAGLNAAGISGKSVAAAVTDVASATETLTVAARSAVDIANERAGLDRQVLELQGDQVALHALDRSAIDASNLARYDEIQALKDTQAAEKAAADTRARVASEAAGLDRQVLELQGDQVALHALDRSAIDASNLARYDEIQALKDTQAAEKAAADTRARVASEAAGLDRQLLELQGDQVALRALDRSAIDASNLARYDEIQALKDTQAATAQAQRDALEVAKSATSSALSGLSAAVDAQKSDLQKSYTDASAAVNTQLGLVNANVSKLAALGSSLTSTISSMTVAGVAYADRLAAQAEISAWALQARSIGALPLDGQIKAAMAVVTQDGAALYSSSVEYQRDFYRTAADLAAINDVAGSQLSAAESQVDLLNRQLELLKSDYSNQVLQLDAIYTTAEQQVAAINGVNTSVLSIAEALAGLGVALSAQAAAKAVVTPASVQQQYSYTSLDGSATVTTSRAFDAAAYLAKYPDLQQAFGDNLGLATQHWREYGISEGRSFARGGVHSGGWRLVGETGPEVEYTGPSRIFSNQATKQIFDVQALLDKLDSVERALALMREQQNDRLEMIMVNTKNTADYVDYSNELAGVN